MADAPSYNCKINVTAQASPNGNSFQFNVPDLVTNDALAVAILPTGSTDRVVLSQPSLSVQSGGVTTGDFSPQASAPPPPSLAPSAASTPGGGSTAQTMPSGPAGTASLSALPPAICDSQHSYGTPASSSGTHGSSLSAAGNAVSSFTSTSTGSNNAKPLAVALSIVVFLLGAGAWLTAGRAAGRAALLDGQSAPA